MSSASSADRPVFGRRDPDARGTVIATAKEWWDGMFPPKAGRK